MIQSRTHNCNELRIGNVGERVTLVGWFENMRKVSKNLGFVILRDFYGTTQLVVETEEMMNVMDGINKESTISVEGVVRERSSKNANLPTGEIEVVPDKIEILGKCIYNALPFEINQSKDADENARLKYRYLDLRNPNMKKNIVMRSQIVAELRQRMYALNFMEITIPILTCSSPEGARDYLVPARNHPGKFYALPQAPQQFKQILMASGFDRYFQIAPCFRDEDARADRSPPESRAGGCRRSPWRIRADRLPWLPGLHWAGPRARKSAQRCGRPRNGRAHPGSRGRIPRPRPADAPRPRP